MQLNNKDSLAWKCDYCEKVFFESDLMIRHLKRVHKVQVDPDELLWETVRFLLTRPNVYQN